MLALKYSKEFKESVVSKVVSRWSRTIQSICEEVGVPNATVSYWVYSCGKVLSNSSQRRRMKWSPEAKLKAVIETTGLAENEAGAYLRKAGLYSNQVSEWRAEIIGHFGAKPKFQKDERDTKISSLEFEILRKDRALAEASALLILQKKVDLIWGNKDAEEK